MTFPLSFESQRQMSIIAALFLIIFSCHVVGSHKHESDWEHEFLDAKPAKWVFDVPHLTTESGELPDCPDGYQRRKNGDCVKLAAAPSSNEELLLTKLRNKYNKTTTSTEATLRPRHRNRKTGRTTTHITPPDTSIVKNTPEIKYRNDDGAPVTPRDLDSESDPSKTEKDVNNRESNGKDSVDEVVKDLLGSGSNASSASGFHSLISVISILPLLVGLFNFGIMR